MLNIRKHSLGKNVVYYLTICTALTLGVDIKETQEPQKLEVSVLVPRAADRPDRTGKWQQKDDKYSPNKKTFIATIFEPNITEAIKRGIKTYDPNNARNTWIVASSYEASQILNDFPKVLETLEDIENYKIILLNPNEDLINFENLESISDSNLSVVEIDKEYNQTYSNFLERFQPKHNQEIIEWVRAKNMYQSDKDWRFLTEIELYRVGRVVTDMLGPKSLPIHKNNTFGPNDLTIEKIIAELDLINKYGPKKEVTNKARMVVAPPPAASRSHYFNGWKDEEVIAYLDHISKWTTGITSPYMTYMSWGDILKEVVGNTTPPPESYSNRGKWEERGFRVLDQHVIDEGSCNDFAWAHAMQGAMIEAGLSGDSINEYEWTRIAQADYKDYKNNKNALSHNRKTNPSTSRRQWNFGAGYGKGIRVMHDFGFEDLMVKGIPLKSGKRFRPTQMVIRDIKDINFYPGTFTRWLKQRVAPEINMPKVNFQLRTTNVREGRYYDHKFELETGYRDAMMKKEISAGRPIVLMARLPNYWNADGLAVKKRGNIVQRAWKDQPRGGLRRTDMGAHALIIVSYKPDPLDSRRTLYECLNSWGPAWGDGGYFWLGSEWLDYFNFDNACRIASISFK